MIGGHFFSRYHEETDFFLKAHVTFSFIPGNLNTSSFLPCNYYTNLYDPRPKHYKTSGSWALRRSPENFVCFYQIKFEFITNIKQNN